MATFWIEALISPNNSDSICSIAKLSLSNVEIESSDCRTSSSIIGKVCLSPPLIMLDNSSASSTPEHVVSKLEFTIQDGINE